MKNKTNIKNSYLRDINKSFFHLTLFILLLIFLIPSIKALSLTDGIFAYYNFDTNGGDVVNGYHNASIYNSIIGNGKLNNGFQCNGINGYADLLYYNSDFDMPTGNFTINYWIKSNTTSSACVMQRAPRGTYANFMTCNWNPGIIYSSSTGSSWNLYGGINVFNSVMILQNWSMITITTRSGRLLSYQNGILYANATQTNFYAEGASVPWQLCRAYSSGNYFNGSLDELGFWNRGLTGTEITDLYNKGNGITYPFIFPQAYNVTLTTSTDINSSSVSTVNYSISITNNNGNMTNGSAILYYKLVESLNPCAIFYQKSCYKQNNTYYNKTMEQINFSSYKTSLNDDEYYPAYYPFNQQFLENSPKQNYTTYTNHNIKFAIYNFTNYTGRLFLDVEFNAINLSSGNPIGIYYCNSSYISGIPTTNINCQLQDSFVPDNLIHLLDRHGNYSQYFNVPLQPTIPKTQLSYIIFATVGTAPNGYNFAYTTNSTYDNSSFQIGQFNSWSNTSFIFDMHIHVGFLGTDYISLYANYTDNVSISSISNTIIDFYNITQFAPSAVQILTPDCSVKVPISYNYESSIYFSWNPSIDLNNDTVTYNLTFANTLLLNHSTNLNYNYTFNQSVHGAGLYNFNILSCDSFLCDNSIGCQVELCAPNWVQSVQPCVDNTKLLLYIDSNSCGSFFDFPYSANGTYTSCVIPLTEGDTQNQILIIGVLAFVLLIFWIIKKRQ